MKEFLKHILWATDYSDESEHALLYAGLLAKTYGSKLSALHVIPDFSPVLYEAHPDMEAELTGKIQAATAASEARIQEISKAKDIKFDDVLVRTGSPDKVICEAVEKEKANLVVVGLTGLGKAAPMGGVVTRLLHGSSVPVLVTKRKKGTVSIKKILVPTDFSDQEDVERDYAWKLAKGLDGSLCFLYIMELFGHDFRLTDELFDSVLKKLKARRKREHEDVEMTEDVYKAATAFEGIVDYAEHHKYDMIVMSTLVKPFARFFLGSTTEKVITLSVLPVFAIPPKRG
jgi:nucleotide-binding universal stress UspA family protein